MTDIPVLHKEIHLNTSTNGAINGTLILKSSETIQLEQIEGHVLLEARGRMSSEKRGVGSFKLKHPDTLVKDEYYEIPFSFEVPCGGRDSYKGKNVELSYKLDIHIDVREEDLEKLDRGVFTRLKSFITSDYSLKADTYFKVQNTEAVYRVKESKAQFKPKTNKVIGVLVFVLTNAIYLSLIPHITMIYFIIGLALGAGMIYLTTHLIGYRLGVVYMETQADEGGFITKIEKPRNFRLSKLSAHYEVEEEVTDSRGSSSSTYTDILHRSEEKKLAPFKRSSEIQFTYPERTGIHSYEHGDVAILWKMYLTGEYLGLKFQYSCPFKVGRVQ